MHGRITRTAGSAAPALLGLLCLAPAAGAQEVGPPAAGAPSLTVELLSLAGSGVHGVVRIYSLPGEGHGTGDGEGPDASGGLHPHRFVVELRGLEPGRSHAVRLHHGRCEAGGPALLSLESVEGGEDGSGASRTVLTAEELMARMREAMDAGGDAPGAHGALHPPFFLQAHAPDGAPAACGNLYLGGGEDGGAVVTVATAGPLPPDGGRGHAP